MSIVMYLELKEDHDPLIADENVQQKRRRLQKLEDVYGTGKQPTLEKIEYNVRKPYLLYFQKNLGCCF